MGSGSVKRATSAEVRLRLLAASVVLLGHAGCAQWASVATPAVAPQSVPGATSGEAVLPAYVPAGSRIGFADAIAAFEASDRSAAPPTDGILFIGSSIFRQWESLAAQMAPLPVFNRAFGGSKTWEVLHYADRVVLPYQPAFVVYYCGSNDVGGNHSAAAIIDRTRQFNVRVHAALPRTVIFYASILRSPDKRAKWAVMDSVNAALREDARRSGGWIRFIDINPAITDASGALRLDLFRPDSLHYRPLAYAAFTSVIKPVLTEAWRVRRR